MTSSRLSVVLSSVGCIVGCLKKVGKLNGGATECERPMALTLHPNIKNLAPPLLVNSELKTLPLNQTLSEFTRRGGWGVRSNSAWDDHAYQQMLPLIITSQQKLKSEKPSPPSPLSLKIRMTFAIDGKVQRPNFQGEGELKLGLCSAVKI